VIKQLYNSSNNWPPVAVHNQLLGCQSVHYKSVTGKTWHNSKAAACGRVFQGAQRDILKTMTGFSTECKSHKKLI